MPPRCYRSRQNWWDGLSWPAQAAEKEKVDFRHVPKIYLCALAKQVDDVKAGVALGDDVAAAKDTGG